MSSFVFFFFLFFAVICDPYHNPPSLCALLPVFPQGACVSLGSRLSAWPHKASCVGGIVLVPRNRWGAMAAVPWRDEPISASAALNTASIQCVGQDGEVFSKQLRKPSCLSVCMCWQGLFSFP